MTRKLKITQVRSVIGRPAEAPARSSRPSACKRNQTSVVHNDTPAIRGMVFKVRHLVNVEEVK